VEAGGGRRSRGVQWGRGWRVRSEVTGAWAGPGRRKENELSPVNSMVFDLFKKFQTNLNVVRSKDGPSKLQKFQIEYVFEGNQIRNKFPYRKFSTFDVEFQLKFKEALEFEFQ
jgi:hypothetical protein